MKISTLCFCLKNMDTQVLLAIKKRGFGTGKWNGYGGKQNNGESIRQAAIRELQEESGLIVSESDLSQVGIIKFYMGNEQLFECHVFLSRDWTGEPTETEEMRPQWYQVNELPFADMWAGDIQWIPMVLSGKKIDADLRFDSDGSTVKDFNYKEVSF